MANCLSSFAYKCFGGHVPEPGELDDEDRALLAQVEAGFQTVGDLCSARKLHAAQPERLTPGCVIEDGRRKQ